MFLFNVHGLEISVNRLLLYKGHSIEWDLLSSRVVIAFSTMTLCVHTSANAKRLICAVYLGRS